MPDTVSRNPVLQQRTSGLTAWAVPLTAAVLAADASGSAAAPVPPAVPPAGPSGFRPQDVRFYFLLFTNWMEDDHLHPGADLDATQVRRTLEHLAVSGLALRVRGRPPRWVLTPAGVMALVEALTDPTTPRRFEEVVLLATVGALYAETIAARQPAEARRIRARLDPRSILSTERRRLAAALADLDNRREDAERLGRAGRAALAEEGDPVAAAVRVERHGQPYQLHPMRRFHEVIASLPPALRRFELEHGWELRARYLFGPLAESLRARMTILEGLERTIREGALPAR